MPAAISPPGRPRPFTCWSIVLPLVVGSVLALSGAQGAFAQDSRNVTLLSHISPSTEPNTGAFGGWAYSSCWSYVHSDGREYATLSSKSGIFIIRLTDPANPVEVGFINLRDSGWHEARQYQDRIYVTTEVGNGVPATSGLAIIDMSDPDHPAKVPYSSDIKWAHTLEVDAARGILYLNGTDNGLRIYSLADRDNPALIAVYPHYAHDTHIRGTRGYASLVYDGVEQILDLTNPAAPALIADIVTPLETTHSSWTTEDGRYLYVTDETMGFSLTVYDISNVSSPRQVWRHEAFPEEMAHNPRIRGNVAYISHYTRGVRLWDVSNGAWPVEFAYYDMSPYPYGGFHGNWEVAPFFPSGIFVASSMEDGLWVFRADAHYGIVRGIVQDAMGNPIEGATVRVLPNGISTQSASDGRYALAVDSPSRPAIEVSAFAYQTANESPNVGTGDDRRIDFTLRRSPAGTMTVAATRAGDAAPLGAAEVNVIGTPLHGTTDASGLLQIGGVPNGTYEVRCVRPGYASKTLPVTIGNNQKTTLPFSLNVAAFYDSLDTDRGWTVGGRDDDATRGIWLRAAPVEARVCLIGQEQVVQPGFDHSPDPGSACFVTGNGTRPCFFGEQSVMGGQTTVTSPVVPLTGLSDPRVGYWRWYLNRVTSFTGDDPLVCQISNDGGSTWLTVESSYANKPFWEYVEIRVANYFPSAASVRVRWIASERGDFSIVEALLDDFAVFSGPGGPALAMRAGAKGGAERIGMPQPSPTRGPMNLELALAKPTPVEAKVFDLRGRLVANLYRGVMPTGAQILRWDGKNRGGVAVAAGVYFVQIRTDEQSYRRKLVVIR